MNKLLRWPSLWALMLVSLIGTTTVNAQCVVPTPYTESFDGSTWTPTTISDPCWTVTPTSTWWQVRNSPTTSSNTGPSGDHTTGSTNYVHAEPTSMSPGGVTAFLTSPSIDLSGLTDPALTFWQHAYGALMDTVKVEVNNGTGWTQIWTQFGQVQTASTDPWIEEIISLTAYVNDTIQIRWSSREGTSGNTFEADFSIDDVSVAEAPDCISQMAVVVDSTTSSEINISWTGATGTSFEVAYGPLGFDPNLPVGSIGGPIGLLPATGSPVQITGLSANTFYAISVRENCVSVPGAFSNWRGAAGLTTCAASFPAPFTEDFEGPQWVLGTGTTSQIDACWTRSATTGHYWFLEVDNTSTLNGPSGDHTTGSGKFLMSSFGAAGNVGTIETPNIDLTGIVNPAFGFWFHFFGDDIGTMRIEANDGTGWVVLDSLVGEYQTAETDPWFYHETSLASYLNGTVQVRLTSIRGALCCDYDLAIDDIVIGEGSPCALPTNFSALTVLATSADFMWTPGTAGNSATLVWGPPGFSPDSAVGSPFGPVGSTTSATGMGTITGLVDNTDYLVYVSDICAGGGNSFWTGPVSIRTQCLAFTAPYSESFDGPSWVLGTSTTAQIDPCWSRTGNMIWYPEDDNTSTLNGPSSDRSGTGNFMFVNGTTNATWDGEFISPLVDMTGVSNPAFSFYFHFFGDDIGTMYIDVNPGTGWVRMDSLVGQYQTAETDPWLYHEISLAAFPNATVQVRFVSNGGGTCCDYDLAIDDVSFGSGSPCALPTNVLASNPTSTSVDVNWTVGTVGAVSNVLWGLPGFSPDSAIGSPNGPIGDSLAFTNSITITGLAPNTEYTFWVAEFCATGGNSFYAGPAPARTKCAPFAAPFFENFDGATWVLGTSTGDIDPCWDRNAIPTSVHSWFVDDDNTSTLNGPPSDKSGTGQFMGAEYGAAGQSAILETPIVSLSGLNFPAVGFWYFFYGDDIGTMTIEANDGSGWVVLDSLVGQYQTSESDPWYYYQISLAAYMNMDVSIRFNSVRGAVCCDYDVAIDEVFIGNGSPCPLPTSLTASPTSASAMDFSWAPGSAGSAAWNVAYGLPGFSPDSVIGSANGPIAILPATATTLNVTGLMGGTNYQFYVEEACPSGGANSFWAGPGAGITPIAPPYLQDFDNGYPPNDGWTQGDGILGEPTVFTSSSSNWVQDTYENVAGGSPSARTNLFSTNFFEWMFSPSIDLGAPGHNWELTFDAAATEYANTATAIWGPGDSLIVVVSTDNGATWNRSNQIMAFHIGNQLTAPGNAYSWSLAPYSGVIKIGFYGTTQGTLSTEDIDVFVDNFAINVPPACPNVSFVSCTGVSTTTSIEVGWTEGTVGATSWEIEYGPAGFTQGTGTVVTATSNPFNVTGLSPSTSYDFYVREQCPNGVDFSNWVGTATCNTDCAPIAAPWSDSFEGNSISQCWVNDPNDQRDWIVFSGSTTSTATGPSSASDGTYYIYVETSGSIAGQKARITSPQLDATGMFFPALSFDYHQYGAGMGWFRVMAMNPTTSTVDTLFAQYGDQGNQWNSLIVPLTGYANSSNVIEVMFELEIDDANGFAFENDLALDNFVFGEDPTFVQSCDNFDAYTAGNLDAQTTDWNSWGGAAGTEDTEVSTEQFQSAPHSMKVHDSGTNSASDIVYSLGDKSSDVYELTFSFYQPAANGGYFNLMHQYSPPATFTWAVEVFLDGPAGTGTIDYGTSAGGNIANFTFAADTWNDVQFIIDLDTDTARMNINGVSIATWQWSDGQGGVYDNLGAMNVYSAAPGTLTPLIYIDDMCFGRYAPPCVVNTTPTTSDVTVCENQPATLTATPGGASSFPVWSNAAGNIIGSGTPFVTDTLLADATFSVRDAELLGGQLKVGPTPDIATAGFGNFTNGLYITVNRAIRLDSITLRTDGDIDVGVNLFDAPGGTLLQTSKQINIAAAGDHQVSVDMVIAPGSYFINMRYDGGTGSLFRATGGATFPYVIPDILSLDSINFSNQIRFYYLFEWVVNEVCLAGATVDADATIDPAPTAAFSLNQTGGGQEVVDFDASGSSSDAVSYAWDFGDGNTGTGATTQHTYAAAGQYTVTLTVTDACGGEDVTTQTVDVTIGLAENPIGTTVALYPNPTRDIANLSFEVLDVQDIEVFVMNAMGQVIYTENLPKFTGVYNNTIDLSSEAKGVYFVQIVTRDGLINRRISLQ